MVIVNTSGSVAQKYSWIPVQTENGGISRVVTFPLPMTIRDNGLCDVSLYLSSL